MNNLPPELVLYEIAAKYLPPKDWRSLGMVNKRMHSILLLGSVPLKRLAARDEDYEVIEMANMLDGHGSPEILVWHNQKELFRLIIDRENPRVLKNFFKWTQYTPRSSKDVAFVYNNKSWMARWFLNPRVTCFPSSNQWKMLESFRERSRLFSYNSYVDWYLHTGVNIRWLVVFAPLFVLADLCSWRMLYLGVTTGMKFIQKTKATSIEEDITTARLAVWLGMLMLLGTRHALPTIVGFCALMLYTFHLWLMWGDKWTMFSYGMMVYGACVITYRNLL